jgi:glycosyltransferase involved in cell wall biosynthesis
VGGTEIHTAEVARRLAERGHDVTVLTTDFDVSTLRKETIDGVKIWSVPAWPRNRDWYFAPKIHSLIAEGHWQVVHCQGYHTLVAPFAMAAAARSGQPYVVTFHSGGHDSRMRRIVRPVQRLALRGLLRKADHLIGVTKYEADFFAGKLGLSPEQISVVSNGVSPGFEPRPRTVLEGQRLICSVGRLARYKGHHRLIEALPELHRRDPSIRVAFVGEGSYRPALERSLKRVGLSHLAEFRSFPPDQRDQLSAFLASSSLVVSLSEHESQGMAILEAISLGCPVLINDTTALKEYGAAGLAQVAPPGCSSHHLSDIVLRCLDAQEGQDTARILPTWEATTDALEEIYRKALGRPAAGRPTTPSPTVPPVRMSPQRIGR